MDLLIQVPDNEAPFFMELLKKFDFVKVKQADNSPVLDSLERSLNEMQAMRASKMPPAIADLFEND
jgi:hypothetical protein